MGRHKKRSSARTKPPSLAPSPSVDPSPPHEKMNVIEDLERAVAAAHGGDLSTALKIINDSLSRYPESAALHSTRGGIHFQVASQTRDSAARVKHLEIALIGDCRALQLASNSISFARYRALTLFELAQNDAAVGYDYDAVIEACERALLLDNPTDPVEDLLDVGGILYVDTPSPVNRIEEVKKKLVKLMEESKKTKKSTTVLGHGDAEEKLKQLVDDNSLISEIQDEIKSLQRRKEEILKASDPQNIHSLYSQDDRLRIEEKRKYVNLKKVVSNVDIIAQARPYWNNTMNFQDKKELLKIGIKELIAHFDRNKLAMAKAILQEAIDFAKTRKFWKFWECCCCGDRFLDGQSNVNHIKKAHLETLSEDLRSMVPEMVSERITNMVELESWKPLDSISAAKMTENLSSEDLKSKIVKWPYCDDSKRAAIIDSIRTWLRWFISSKCFTMSLLIALLKIAVSKLKARFFPEQVVEVVRKRRPFLLIFFLEVSELNSLVELLENLAGTCGLRSICETSVNVNADLGFCERIVFSADFSRLLFDERYLRGEIGEPDDGSAVTCHADNDEAEEVIITYNGDAFVYWLWIGGPTIGEQMKEWTNTREASEIRGMMLFNILKTEFGMLQRVCQRKWEILRYEKPLLNLKNIYLEENEKREEISGYKPQSYHSLLLNRQREIEMKGDFVTDSSGFELHTIRSILEGAQTDADIEQKIKKKRLWTEVELYKVDALILVTNASMRQTGLTLEMVSACDYRSILVPLLKSLMQARLQDQVDKDAAEKSNTATEALLAELALDDEKNTNKGQVQGKGKSKGKKKKQYYKKAQDSKGTGGGKEQHPPRQENVEQSCFSAGHGGNYPSSEIDVPVRTDELKQQEEELLREAEEEARMLDEAIVFQMKMENEAKQKRLAEQNKSAGESSAENVATVSSKAGEDAGSSEQQACFSAGHGGNYPNPEIGVPVSIDELKQQEKQLRLEAEEVLRKLDEVLELQRKIEHEAKQKRLAEQNKSTGETGTENLEKAEAGEDFGSSEQQARFSVVHGGNYPNAEIGGVPVSTDELKQREEELSSESEEELGFEYSEEFRRRLDEELERFFKIEYEAKQKILSEQRSTRCALINVKSVTHGEDVGSSEQQQRQSEPTPLNVTVVFSEAGENVGSSEQQRQLETIPLSVAKDVTDVSSEANKDVGSSESNISKDNLNQYP